jgi:hypothetical protein
MMRRWLVFGVLVIALLSAGTALAQSGPGVTWWAFGSGGGAATVGDVSLAGGVGQWMVGSTSSGGSTLSSGFWGGAGIDLLKVYLPFICR